jgi:adenosyl cobinamide kinase/adenosyl cobinamide phosphate guanylyltransferase
MLTVLLGGARSGKSAAAERLATRAVGEITYLATCPRIDGDADLAARIDRHRADRPDCWITIEEDIDLAGALESVTTPTVIVDCLTTWVGTLVHHGRSDDEVHAASRAAISAVGDRHAIVVTNEVGLGIVPATELARRYRDLLGRVNQQWVGGADRALLLVAGRALDLQAIDELL